MLRSRILPSGIGHTTNCFLQVEGCEGNEAYIVTETLPDERRSVQVYQLSTKYLGVMVSIFCNLHQNGMTYGGKIRTETCVVAACTTASSSVTCGWLDSGGE